MNDGFRPWRLRRFLGLGCMNPELLVANSRGDPAWLKLEGFARTRCSGMLFSGNAVLKTKPKKPELVFKSWV